MQPILVSNEKHRLGAIGKKHTLVQLFSVLQCAVPLNSLHQARKTATNVLRVKNYNVRGDIDMFFDDVCTKLPDREDKKAFLESFPSISTTYPTFLVSDLMNFHIFDT